MRLLDILNRGSGKKTPPSPAEQAAPPPVPVTPENPLKKLFFDMQVPTLATRIWAAIHPAISGGVFQGEKFKADFNAAVFNEQYDCRYANVPEAKAFLDSYSSAADNSLQPLDLKAAYFLGGVFRLSPHDIINQKWIEFGHKGDATNPHRIFLSGPVKDAYFYVQCAAKQAEIEELRNRVAILEGQIAELQRPNPKVAAVAAPLLGETRVVTIGGDTSDPNATKVRRS